MAGHEDDEDDTIDPMNMLLPPENGFSLLHEGAAKPQLQQHYIPSVKSTLEIRQLPSEGLSFQLWPAATTLVILLDLHRRDPSSSPMSSTLAALSDGSDYGSLNILELGSGTGLGGIAAAVTLGAKVTVTDLPHVLPNLQLNVDANAGVVDQQGGSVQVAALRWGEAEDVKVIGRDFDLVLASDVVYHDHLYDPLLKTLRLLLAGDKKTVFLMAHLKRWKKEAVFFKKAKKLFEIDTIHVDPPKEGSRVGVIVYRFVGKHPKGNVGSTNNYESCKQN